MPRLAGRNPGFGSRTESPAPSRITGICGKRCGAVRKADRALAGARRGRYARATMPRINHRAGCAVVTSVWLFLIAIQPSDAATGKLAVRVTDAGTGKPIPARLSLRAS